MARQRRTLDEQIAELSTRNRSVMTEALSVPAMEPLGPSLIADDAILNEHLSAGAVRLENLDDEISENLDGMAEALDKAASDLEDLNFSLGEAQSEMVDLDIRLDTAAEDLLSQGRRIDDEILPAIDDAAASPITDARMKPGSITVWPFTTGTVPAGALAPGAVGSNEIADFALVARKFKDDRHRIY